MRVETVQIVWHDQKPVFSVDFSPEGDLVTSGGDRDIKVWKLSGDGNEQPITVSYAYSFPGNHTGSVNCIRLSPTGDTLASGGDNGEVILWRNTGVAKPIFGSENSPASPWKVLGVLRGHSGDVMDVSWSSDGSTLATGSVDNSAIVWSVPSGRRQATLEDHKHFVQGVALDPSGELLATQSADRSLRIYKRARQATSGKSRRCSSGSGRSAAAAVGAGGGADWMLVDTVTTSRGVGSAISCAASQENEKPAGEAAAAGDVEVAAKASGRGHSLFQDEKASLFFRRLQFSLDGAFLVAPAGWAKAAAADTGFAATHLLPRHCFARPAASLPSLTSPSLCCRFCPLVFQSQPASPRDRPPALQLPYRLVFAVATHEGAAVYATDARQPLAVLGGLHYASITDLAWSCDGSWLAVSSLDGYCTLVRWSPSELGQPADTSSLPPHLAAWAAAAAHCAPLAAAGPASEPSAAPASLPADPPAGAPPAPDTCAPASPHISPPAVAADAPAATQPSKKPRRIQPLAVAP